MNLELFPAPPFVEREPMRKSKTLVVSYGGGVDSTALIVGLWRRGERPDVILFANVGNEWPETYDYLPVFDTWLQSIGFPKLTIVRNRSPRAKHMSLEENCVGNETMPGQVFKGGKPGGGNCSAKWKHEPMDRWLLQNGYLERDRLIGYDAGVRDSRRAAKGSVEAKKHRRDHFAYRLQEWGWDRERCEREIVAAGLPLPRKSSCWFCPAMKKHEIRDLARKHPDLLRRAVVMEQKAIKGKHTVRRLAQGKTVSVAGLGRSWSWESLARSEKLLSEYGGPIDDPTATNEPSEAAKTFLREREVLV